jgi:DNA repair protein RadC
VSAGQFRLSNRSYFMSHSSSVVNSVLWVRDVNGCYQVANAEDVVSAARVAIDQRTARGSSMGCPARVKEYLVTKLGGFDHEVFGMLLLDTQLRLISYVELFHGTIDSAAVYPREVVRCVLNHNANAVILAHNHPSGCPDPSAADRALTERLAAALKLIDVRTLDHVIVGGVQTSSFAEMGLL